MVWQSSQSALYKAVAEYNREQRSEDNCSNCAEKPRENCADNCAQKCENNCGNNCTASRKINNKMRNCECNCNKCRKNTRANNPLSEIFADGDFLMIAALIFILYKNGADQKLILALVLVLLG